MIVNYSETGAEQFVSAVREMVADKGKRAFVFTFGCQQNEADSERMRGLFVRMGYSLADSFDDADVIILNTCAIREHAEMKALSMLGRFKALKAKNPELIIGLCGCMAAEEGVINTLKRSFRQVNFTLEPMSIYRIPEMIYNALRVGERAFPLGDDRGDIIEGLPAVRSFGHKAWVTVMYGCNNFCSYCIVPYTRGRERSRSSADIIAECRELVAGGVKEITLLGQNVNSYRSDMSFAELISAIAEIEGDFIIRFMTSHPKDTSVELIEAMGKYSPKIAPYFHLPMQSGSDAVLKAMNRTYDSKRYLDIVEKLRRAVPGIAISTDIIVGFPGESEEDFLLTLEMQKKVGFDMIYAFIYSPREGTRAARMENQIEQSVKSERISRVLEIQDEISEQCNAPYLGRTLRVLLDDAYEKDGKIIYKGRTDTGKLVQFSAKNAEIGKFINVKIEKCGPYILTGTAEER